MFFQYLSKYPLMDLPPLSLDADQDTVKDVGSLLENEGVPGLLGLFGMRVNCIDSDTVPPEPNVEVPVDPRVMEYETVLLPSDPWDTVKVWSMNSSDDPAPMLNESDPDQEFVPEIDLLALDQEVDWPLLIIHALTRTME